MKLSDPYKMPLNHFQDYVWSVYGPGEVYGNFFQNELTRQEMDAACFLISKTKDYEGDTIDREKARALLLASRGEKTEYFG